MVKIGVYAVAAVLSLSGGSQRRPGWLCNLWVSAGASRANIALYARTTALYVTHPIALATGCVWTRANVQLCIRQRAWCSLKPLE